MRKTLLVLIAFMILFTGCENVNLENNASQENLQNGSNTSVVCNQPYIRVGDSCCLDKNNNSVCDDDEVNKSSQEETNTTTKEDINKSIENNNKNTTENLGENESKIHNKTQKDKSAFESCIVTYEHSDNGSVVLEQYTNKNITSKKDCLEQFDDVYDKKRSDEFCHVKGTDFEVKYRELIGDSYNTIEEKYCESEVEEFITCEIKAYDNSTKIIEEKEFLNDDIYSKTECVEKYDEQDFTCSQKLRETKAFYRENNQDDYEVIEEYNCPKIQEDKDEKKTIVLGTNETTNISLGNSNFKITLESLSSGIIEEISIDGENKNNLEVFNQVKQGEVYIYPVNVIPSTRASVKGYSEFVVGNYDFTLEKEDVRNSCYDSKNSQGKTSALSFLNDSYEVYESSCVDNSTLNQFTCSDDKIDEKQINCEYGCEGGVCLTIKDVGCSKDSLSSGIKESTLTNGSGTLSGIYGNSTFNITIKAATETQIYTEEGSFEMCESKTIDNTTILIHDIFKTQGYIEYSYE